MARKTASGHPKGSPEDKLFKLRKILPSGVPEEMEGMDVERLKAQILQSNENIMRIRREEEENETLNAAKVQLKDLRAPYNDAKKVQDARIQYALYLLESKGVL